MDMYEYRARDASGSVVQDTITGDSRYDALAQLKGRGLTVIELDESAGSARVQLRQPPPKTSSAPASSVRMKARRFFAKPVKLTDVAVLCRQLAISVSSGVPLRDSLEAICEDIEHPTLRYTLDEVVKDLHEGMSFSNAVERHPNVFDRLFCALIRSAEESGSMPTTLDHLADAMEKAERLMRKIVSIAVYPMFIIVGFVVAVIVMTVFILPSFRESFASLNTELPPLTLFVFGLNEFMLQNGLVIMSVLGALVIAGSLFGRTERGRRTYDRIKLATPIFGTVLQKISVTRVCRNLAIMLRGGVPITTALEIAADIAGNEVMREAMFRVRDRIVSGSDFSSSIGREDVFPKLVVRMVGVGEASGRLPEVMDKVSDAFEDQVEGSVTIMTSLFEPIIIVVFGMVILVLILAIYFPVFTIGSGGG